MGKVFTSMCQQIGVHKVFTSPYHPQTDGFIERFNQTLLRDLRAYVSANEDDWDSHIAMACFCYNTTVHEATGVTPYKAVFGIDAFDFDAELGRWMAMDQEVLFADDLPRRIATVHQELISRSLAARMSSAKQYNKLVLDTEFFVGDRVMVYNPQFDKEVGRKL